jgi:hypothetical protein
MHRCPLGYPKCCQTPLEDGDRDLEITRRGRELGHEDLHAGSDGVEACLERRLGWEQHGKVDLPC